MNIDDRLEALAQSVELLASLHKGNERMLGRLEKQIEKLAQVTERKGKQIDRLEGLVTEIAERNRASASCGRGARAAHQ